MRQVWTHNIYSKTSDQQSLNTYESQVLIWRRCTISTKSVCHIGISRKWFSYCTHLGPCAVIQEETRSKLCKRRSWQTTSQRPPPKLFKPARKSRHGCLYIYIKKDLKENLNMRILEQRKYFLEMCIVLLVDCTIEDEKYRQPLWARKKKKFRVLQTKVEVYASTQNYHWHKL